MINTIGSGTPSSHNSDKPAFASVDAMSGAAARAVPVGNAEAAVCGGDRSRSTWRTGSATARESTMSTAQQHWPVTSSSRSAGTVSAASRHMTDTLDVLEILTSQHSEVDELIGKLEAGK